ncbi:GNAT family protein [Mycolicibacterium sp. 120266]|uniref:GNAT family N-acetyltransferase n=1 Tax=Mycolicibacterium sp. 120266 TaxID=3090601 RepID=UPI00299E529B|nr:GNAT family protein [Mycolicibacterium sp. 120266]MDX1871105.1 GNAT family protein [Mycolicibacterium sp. 120266]
MADPIWPLAELEVTTPNLVLRYITDELATELAVLAARGIHDPATMPFSEPWTDVASPQLERNTLQYLWRCRAEVTPEHWDIPLAVVVDGRAVGVCTVHAEDFPQRRSVTTGSWLGRAHQGRGIGKEMRQAALHLIFAGMGAQQARTRAWHDNAASLAVTRSLPYVRTGDAVEPRRDRGDVIISFAMSRDRWETIRRSDIRLDGVEAVAGQLGFSAHRSERERQDG